MNFIPVKEVFIEDFKERQTFYENIVEQEDIDWIGKAIYHLQRFSNLFQDKTPFKNLSETDISLFIRDWLDNVDNTEFHNDLLTVDNETRTKGDFEGFYDLKIKSLFIYWQKYIPFEAKRLSMSESKVKEYVYVVKKGKPNGGVYRFVQNEKYAAKQNFGGMLGYIQSGNAEKVIEKIKTKLKKTQEINLLKPEIIEKQIENTPNSFQSLHQREVPNEKVMLYHVFFDFT